MKMIQAFSLCTISLSLAASRVALTHGQTYGNTVVGDNSLYSNGDPLQIVPTSPPSSIFLAEPLTEGKNPICVLNTNLAGSNINVHWQTPYALCSAPPTVKYGTSSTSFTNTATGSSLRLGRVPPCNSTNYRQCSDYFYDVELSGLQSGVVYYYQIEADACSGQLASPIYSVKAPLAAGHQQEYQIYIYGDMGYTNAADTRYRLLQGISSVDFVYHVGDLAYADQWNYYLEGGYPVYPPNLGDETNSYTQSWDNWQQWMNNVSTKVPYMVIPGNHEVSCLEGDSKHLIGNGSYYDCPQTQRNFTQYNLMYKMPSSQSNTGLSTAGRSMWWSQNYGQVHYIGLNSNTDYRNSIFKTFAENAYKNTPDLLTASGPFSYEPSPDQEATAPNNAWGQVAWLEEDLKRVDRSKTPWIVCATHHPLYTAEAPFVGGDGITFNSSFSGYHNTYSPALRAAFESLFIQYGVDLVYTGHVHWYERSYPLQQNGYILKSAVNNFNNYTATETAPVYITQGNAGNVEGHNSMDPNVAFQTARLDDSNFGYGKLTVYNSTTLYYQYFHATDGVMADDLWLVKSIDHTATAAATATATATAPSSSSSAKNLKHKIINDQKHN